MLKPKKENLSKQKIQKKKLKTTTRESNNLPQFTIKKKKQQQSFNKKIYNFCPNLHEICLIVAKQKSKYHEIKIKYPNEPKIRNI